MSKAFITGSFEYGYPTEHSDVDLVVPMDLSTFNRLAELLTQLDEDKVEVNKYADETSELVLSIKYGVLNLICVITKPLYDAWRIGTDQLQRAAPVTRQEAVELLSKLREIARTKVEEA